MEVHRNGGRQLQFKCFGKDSKDKNYNLPRRGVTYVSNKVSDVQKHQ